MIRGRAAGSGALDSSCQIATGGLQGRLRSRRGLDRGPIRRQRCRSQLTGATRQVSIEPDSPVMTGWPAPHGGRGRRSGCHSPATSSSSVGPAAGAPAPSGQGARRAGRGSRCRSRRTPSAASAGTRRRRPLVGGADRAEDLQRDADGRSIDSTRSTRGGSRIRRFHFGSSAMPWPTAFTTSIALSMSVPNSDDDVLVDPGPRPGPVRGDLDLAVRDRVDDAVEVAQRRPPQAEVLDRAGHAGDRHHVALAELVLDEDQAAVEVVADEALGAEADRDPDDAEAGDRGTDVDPDRRRGSSGRR